MASLTEIQNVLYEDCPYTNFPSAVDTITRKADVGIDTRALVEQYNTYLAAGNYSAATQLLANNIALRQVMMVAEDWNRVRDGLVAVQRVFNSYVADYIAAVVKSKGEFSGSVTYEKYNVVTYTLSNSVRTYICLPQDDTLVTIPVGTPPTDSRYWVCITMEGRHGASGTGFAPRGAYDSETVYYKDELVVKNGNLYVATTSDAEDPMTVYTTTEMIYEANPQGGYSGIAAGTEIDSSKTYYMYDEELGTYTEIETLTDYVNISEEPYEIYDEDPENGGSHWQLLEITHVADEIIAGTTIQAAAWSNGTYTLANAKVNEDTLVEAFFNPSSFAACAEAGIYVESTNAGIVFHCTDDAPSESVVVDYFRLRNDVLA